MSLSPRSWIWVSPILVSLLLSSARAGEFTKLLPSDASIIVSVNLQQILDEPSIKKSAHVQKILEGGRLALKGDEKQLRGYFKSWDLKIEGATEEDFLKWAKEYKAFCAARDLDPSKDIDRVTCAIRLGGAWSDVTIVEGTFKPDKFKAAAKAESAKKPDSFNSYRLAGFDVCEWDDTDEPGFRNHIAVSPKILVIASNTKKLAEILDLAAGKKKSALPKGMQTLLTEVEKEQIVFVMNSGDMLFKFIEDNLIPGPRAKDDTIGTWVQDQIAAWLKKFGKDIAELSVGLTFAADDFKLPIGLNTKSPRVAKDLRTWTERANYWGIALMKCTGGEVPLMYAEILQKEKLTIKDSALFLDVRIPYKFVKKILDGPWL